MTSTTINANTNAEKLFFVPVLADPEPVLNEVFVYLIRKISPDASEETYNRFLESNATPTGLTLVWILLEGGTLYIRLDSC
jgi:hypothetical protein